MNAVIEDLLHHQKNFTWSEEILQMSFLIKYCDYSAYRRLWILSNFKLPHQQLLIPTLRKKLTMLSFVLQIQMKLT